MHHLQLHIIAVFTFQHSLTTSEGQGQGPGPCTHDPWRMTMKDANLLEVKVKAQGIGVGAQTTLGGQDIFAEKCV